LVIESAFVGRGTDFAWVVPLPAKPEVESATRGTLASMAALMQPVVIAPQADLWWLIGGVVVVAVWTLVFGWKSAGLLLRIAVVVGGGLVLGAVLAGVFGHGWLLVPLAVGATCWLLRDVMRREASLLSHLIVVLFGLLLFALMIPTMGTVRSALGPVAEAAGVTVERHLVGEHEVALVSGSDVDGVVGWLRENGYAITGEAEAVAREHAAAGGWFAASRVRRERMESGRSVPAPLLFRFASERPVYPMRLTGAGATRPLELELFVLGPARAAVRGLKPRAWGPVRLGDPAVGAYGRGVRQPRDARVITHPQLVRLAEGVGEAVVATRLSGRLAPEQMREDLWLEWAEDGRPAAGLVAWAREAAAQGALLAGGALALAVSIISGSRRGGARASRPTLAAALAAAGVLGVLVWSAIPSVATRAVETGRVLRWYELRQVPQVALIAAGKLDPERVSDEEARAVFAAELKRMLLEPSGTELEIGDGPGQVQWVKTPEGKWRTVHHDAAGQARFDPRHDFELGWELPER
jgi:hypothetical protein